MQLSFCIVAYNVHAYFYHDIYNIKYYHHLFKIIYVFRYVKEHNNVY